jgi:hypothetical protein
MKILVACERSGQVRRAFAKLGHHVVSADIQPAEDWEYTRDRVDCGVHYCGDVRDILDDYWDMLIAFPDCTYLCSSGMHWTTRGLRDKKLTEDALDFVKLLMGAPIKHKAIENPIGCISTRIRKPDQIIQPWMFGDDASKATCLWLENLPKLEPTNVIEPRIVNGKKRWSNQTDSGQNRLPPSKTRAMDRARTYGGVAQAMADKWGNL